MPPLKFGSLVDSKPFSDEESSMITQSMPTEGPKVPLNGKNEDLLIVYSKNCMIHLIAMLI